MGSGLKAIWNWITKDLKFTDLLLVAATCSLTWATIGLWAAAAHSDDAFHVQADIMQNQLSEMTESRVSSDAQAITSNTSENKKIDLLIAQTSELRGQSVSSQQLVEASRLQMKASQSQAVSLEQQTMQTRNLVKTAESQLNIQRHEQFETNKPIITAQFLNPDMNSFNAIAYDTTMSFNFSMAYRNLGKDTALALVSIQPQLVKSGDSVKPRYCLNLECPGGKSNRIAIQYNDSMTTNGLPWQLNSNLSVDELAKQNYKIYVMGVIDFIDIKFTNSYDHVEICKVYSFFTKTWSVCTQ